MLGVQKRVITSCVLYLETKKKKLKKKQSIGKEDANMFEVNRFRILRPAPSGCGTDLVQKEVFCGERRIR